LSISEYSVDHVGNEVVDGVEEKGNVVDVERKCESLVFSITSKTRSSMALKKRTLMTLRERELQYSITTKTRAGIDS
jgi:hypothetical protein